MNEVLQQRLRREQREAAADFYFGRIEIALARFPDYYPPAFSIFYITGELSIGHLTCKAMPPSL